MGSACCVAAREKPLQRTRDEQLRNFACSPSWSFRWDNRRCVADEIEQPSYQLSNRLSRNVSMERKGTLSSGRQNISDRRSALEIENYETPTSRKSPVHENISRSMMTPSSVISRASNYSIEVNDLVEWPDTVDSSATKLSFCIPSPFSLPITKTLCAHNHVLPSNSTPSRGAPHSPGHRLLRQVSDSQILGMKSPNDCSMSERSSFVLSTCNNDFTTGSNGGSSDGWSMRTFSELVTSSQRERWSFDSEHFVSGDDKISGCSSRFSHSPTTDTRTCGACSKLLAERSSWRSNEISVVAVLVCGHVYHAECLETITPVANRCDPACPKCVVGEKQVSKMSRKALAKNLKLFKNRVKDSFVYGGCTDFNHQRKAKQKGKAPKLEPNLSRRSSLAKPFLKRHFSIGSKWGLFASS